MDYTTASDSHNVDGIVTKRLQSLLCLSLILFLGGVEYGLILPTLNQYLIDLGTPQSWWLGLILAAFPFAMMLAAPVVGWMSDFMSMRIILVVTMLLSSVGSIIYAIAPYSYVVLISRLITGLGAGNSAVIMAYVVRVTNPQERTSIITRVLATQEAGLLFGPAFNFFLTKADFFVGSMHVTKLTVPGWFMAILTLLGAIMIAVLFHDPPPINRNEHDEEEEASEQENRLNDTNDERDTLIPKRSRNWFQGSNPLSVIRDSLTLPILTVLLAEFVLLFNQNTLETVLTPFTAEYLTPPWTGEKGEIQNSELYIGVGVAFMAIYLFLHFIQKYVSDRYLISIGLCFEACALALFLVFLPDKTSVELWKFILGVGVFISGLPFLMVAVPSLFSKLTSKNHQGLLQGILQMMTSLGCILGPLFAGFLFPYFRLMFGVELGLLGLLIFMYTLSFKGLYFEIADDAAINAIVVIKTDSDVV